MTSLAPTLFSIFFAVLLTHAFKDCDQGTPLQFRTSGKVFNLRRFNTKSEIFVELIWELLYADEAVFLAHRQTDIQHIMDHFSWPCNALGLNSPKKIKIIFTPAPGKLYIETNITVNDARLDVVDNFIYLEITVSRYSLLDAKIYSRISKASIAFGKLEKRTWADCDISQYKNWFYRTCVIILLLYSAETWTTHKRHIKLLEHFHKKYLRHILNIKWQTHTPTYNCVWKSWIPKHYIRYRVKSTALGWSFCKHGRHYNSKAALLWGVGKLETP